MLYRISFIFSFFVIGCSYFIKNVEPDSDKFFLGSTDTKFFQKHVEQVVLENGYTIEYYENDAFSSNIITRWKTRDPYPIDIEKGFLDTKSRLIFSAVVINNTYRRNNGFDYDCFLTVENKAFNGNNYVHYRVTGELNDYINQILKQLREKFDYN